MRKSSLGPLLSLAVAALVAGCGGVDNGSREIATVNCSGIGSWTVGTAYSAGSAVSYNGKVYQCVQSHTALAGWTPDAVPALWAPAQCSSGSSPPVGGSTGGGTSSGGSSGGGSNTCNASTWTAGTQYHAGDVVKYPANGNYYKASHDNPGYDPTISTWFWDPYTCSGGSTGGGSTGGGSTGGGSTGGGSGLASILSESTFNAMFPSRNSFYTYQGLVNATASYGSFAKSGDATAQKREVAAFLANVAHETGGLIYVEEIVKGDYCQPSAGCPCAPGKQYYGRGPLQLSWNYNYCAAGAALNLPLQAQPELVAQNATIAWQTGLWFWMTSTGSVGQTCHDAAVGGNFGNTIRVINGGLECNGNNVGEMQDRVQYYQHFCQLLGVDPGSALTC